MRLVRTIGATPPFAVGLLAAATWPLVAERFGAASVLLVLALGAAAALALQRAARALAAVLVLTPLAGASLDALDPSSVLPSHPVPLLLVAVSAALILHALTQARVRPVSRLPWSMAGAFVAFFAISLVASMQGIRPGAGALPLVHLAGGAVVFLAVVMVGDTRQRLLVIVAGAMGGLVVAGAQGVFGKVLGIKPLYGFATDQSVVTRVQGSFTHPNKYGLFLALLLPLAGALAVDRRAGRRLRCLAAAGVVLGLPALVMSYSRGALIGLTAGSLLWLLAVRPRLALRVAAVVLVAAIAFAPTSLRHRFEGASTGSDLSDRSVLWHAAVEIYADHPLLGVGVGSFPDAYVGTRSVRAAGRPLLNQGDGETLPYHAHNAFLTVAAEQGAMGLLALLAFALTALATVLRGSRVRDPVGRTICMGAGAALCVWAVDNLFNVSLYEETTLPLVALIAVAWGFVVLDERAEGAEAR